jgi:uncharacterized protein (TIGR02246 family)
MEQYKPLLQPQDIPERFKEVWNRYDPDGIANLFVDNADFVNVTGKWWDSKRDIWEAHDFGLRVIFQHSKMEVLKVKVKMLSEDIAVVHARIRIMGQTEKEVDSAGLRETMFLFVARKVDDEWLCESAQNTDIVFGKQTNIRDEDGNLKSVSYKEKLVKITRDLNEE